MAQNIEYAVYKIPVYVTDRRGRRCVQPHLIPVRACRCDSSRRCTESATRVIIIKGSGTGTGGGSGGSGGTGGGGGGGGTGDGDGGGSIGSGGDDTSTTSDGMMTTDWYDVSVSITDEDTSIGGFGGFQPGARLGGPTTLSAAAVGLMFLGGLILVCKYSVKCPI